MVNLGFIPPTKTIPSPDMSFMRLFKDNSIGWQQRGQYAIWMGASAAGSPPYRLLERVGNRVARIEHADGGPVFHKIAAGVPFLVENMAGFWLTFDSDAMWVDTRGPDGRYAVLAVGGSAGKPGQGVVDWTCPKCGSSMNAHTVEIGSNGFKSFLNRANEITAEFNADEGKRTCGHCHAVHPTSFGYTKAE